MNKVAIKNILVFLLMVSFIFYFFITVLGVSEDEISLENFVVGEDLLTISTQLNLVFSDEEILSYIRNFRTDSLLPKINISIPKSNLFGRINPFSFEGPSLEVISTPILSDDAIISTTSGEKSTQVVQEIEEEEINL